MSELPVYCISYLIFDGWGGMLWSAHYEMILLFCLLENDLHESSVKKSQSDSIV